ncbi:hypothetical protein [Nocardia sp. NRRL S-836]|uniref:hypothetical protein n=1 Tax=Nocardia sp. NRRL S-836 TaxID=1519492 RepID=UPI0006AF3C87|nr:hypothetical protein [Nocardia sp. NRRL S-836]KOV84981.1 hypothetical protein ADL03_11460 [Nocardia sp. NRRL S-836]
MKRIALVAVALLTACSAPLNDKTPQVEHVTVFADAALTEAFTKIAVSFTETYHVVPVFTFGSSSRWRRR